MRAHEFITEIVSLKGTAPKTLWKTDVDTDGVPVDLGVWKDPAGQEIQNIFQKKGNGSADIYFNRQTKTGTPSFKVTGTGGQLSPAIMQGVVQNIKDYLNKNPDIRQVKFDSHDASRTRLYNAMVDRLAPQMGLIGTSSTDGEQTTYSLRKAEAGEQHQPLKTQRPKRPPAEPRDPNAKPVDLTRPPRNRPKPQAQPQQPQGGGSSGKSLPGLPFSPQRGGGGAGGGMRDFNPFKIPFSEAAPTTMLRSSGAAKNR